jgi:NTE family protein
MIKYVPIKGGGRNLIAYITFVQKIWPLLVGVKEYAGASAGSIVSGFLAAGYTPDELYSELSTFNFTNLEDGGLFVSAEGILSPRHGLHPGKWFENWAEKMFAAKLGKPKATFRDLKEAGRPGFSAVTTYINEGDAVILNYASTPDVILSEAIRASMGIPLLFDLFSFTQGMNEGQLFCDGGEKLNYPINLFDGYSEEEVLGLYLHDVSNVQPPIHISGFRSFIDAHFEALLSASDSWLFPNDKWMRQTVIIDTKGQSPTDFKPTPEDIAILEQSGTEAANKYLKSKTQ